MKPAFADSKSEMIRRLRLGNLRKLFRDRYGPTLPDDDAGREDMRELLLPISVGPHAAIKMPKAIEVWAPWMQLDEAAQLIDDINSAPIWRRMSTAKQLGQRQRATNGERERLKLWTIAPYNLNRQELLQQRKAKAKARMRLLRQMRGSKSRAEYEAASINRAKPWIAAGISRATYYRRHETSPCAVGLLNAANAPVSPQQAQLPKAVRARAADATK